MEDDIKKVRVSSYNVFSDNYDYFSISNVGYTKYNF